MKTLVDNKAASVVSHLDKVAVCYRKCGTLSDNPVSVSDVDTGAWVYGLAVYTLGMFEVSHEL